MGEACRKANHKKCMNKSWRDTTRSIVLTKFGEKSNTVSISKITEHLKSLHHHAADCASRSFTKDASMSYTDAWNPQESG